MDAAERPIAALTHGRGLPTEQAIVSNRTDEVGAVGSRL